MLATETSFTVENENSPYKLPLDLQISLYFSQDPRGTKFCQGCCINWRRIESIHGTSLPRKVMWRRHHLDNGWCIVLGNTGNPNGTAVGCKGKHLYGGGGCHMEGIKSILLLSWVIKLPFYPTVTSAFCRWVHQYFFCHCR